MLAPGATSILARAVTAVNPKNKGTMHVLIYGLSSYGVCGEKPHYIKKGGKNSFHVSR